MRNGEENDVRPIHTPKSWHRAEKIDVKEKKENIGYKTGRIQFSPVVGNFLRILEKKEEIEKKCLELVFSEHNLKSSIY